MFDSTSEWLPIALTIVGTLAALVTVVVPVIPFVSGSPILVLASLVAFYVAHNWPAWWYWAAVVTLVAIGAIVDTIVHAAGVNRAGGSSKAVVGAGIGAMVGPFVLVFLGPLALVAGAPLGAIAGAMIGEHLHRAGRNEQVVDDEPPLHKLGLASLAGWVVASVLRIALVALHASITLIVLI